MATLITKTNNFIQNIIQNNTCMYADDKRFTCEYMLLQGEQRFIFDSPAY